MKNTTSSSTISTNSKSEEKLISNFATFTVTGKIIAQSTKSLTIQVDEDNKLQLHLRLAPKKSLLGLCVYATGEIINGVLEMAEIVVCMRSGRS